MSKLNALELNKLEFIKICKSHNIAKVEVCYDGFSDSGQISESMATMSEEFGDHRRCSDFDIDCEYYGTQSSRIDGQFVDDISFKQGSFEDLMEELAYDILYDKFGGWEINEGSYGCLTFHACGKITYEHTVKIEETHTGEIQDE